MLEGKRSENAASRGKIITFYSYKGGVGRSMALANVAVLLAKAGKKVLIVDWDLEAPGIDRYFREQKIKKANNSGGLLLLLKAYQFAAEEVWYGTDARASLLAFLRRYVRELFEEALPSSCAEVSTTVTLDSGHTLDIIASGEAEESYSSDIAAFSWRRFFSEFDGAVFIEWLREFWSRNYDFILIDSRTGVTDAGGICTVQLPDYLVLVLSANDQNLEGAIRVLKGVHEARASFGYDRRRLMVIPLLSRFDGRAESALSSHWLQRCAGSMQLTLNEWLPKHTPALEYFDKTKLPHLPRFAFGEQLAVLYERETDPDTLTFYYSAIARLLAGNLVRPERLLALPRRMSDAEKEDIFRRAAEQQKSRNTIAQIEDLISSLPKAARAQAEQMRAQIEKLDLADDALREDLEAIALDAIDESERKLALGHLIKLPGWTSQDTTELQQEIIRRTPGSTHDVGVIEPGYIFISSSAKDKAVVKRIRTALSEVSCWYQSGRPELGISELGMSTQKLIADKIADCTLFMPIISEGANLETDSKLRFEWNQAADRARTMAGTTFICPIVIDETKLSTATVPKVFLLSQWFKFPKGQIPKGFVRQVRKLLEERSPVGALNLKGISFKPMI